MPLLRDLVTRLTFKVDTEPLRKLDTQVGKTKLGIGRIATALAGTLGAGLSLRAGGNLLLLREQLSNLTQGSLKPFADAILKLQGISGGFFKEQDLLKSGIAARQAGINIEEAAGLLDVASKIFVPGAGGDIFAEMQKLVNALQFGGVAQVFREAGVVGKGVEDAINFIEGKITQAIAAGTPVQAAAIREFNRRILRELTTGEIGERLNKQFEEFLLTPAASFQRVTARITDTWQKTSAAIVIGLAPAIDSIANLINQLDLSEEGFKGFNDTIKTAVEFLERLVKGKNEFFNPDIPIEDKLGDLSNQPEGIITKFFKDRFGVDISGAFPQQPVSVGSQSLLDAEGKQVPKINMNPPALPDNPQRAENRAIQERIRTGGVTIHVQTTVGQETEEIARRVAEIVKDWFRQVGNNNAADLEVNLP